MTRQRLATKAPANRRKLDDIYIRNTTKRMTWDTVQGGLCLRVYGTGRKVFKVCYRHNGKLRWYTIDRYGAIGIKEARFTAREIRAKATLGQDPHGDRMQARKQVREAFKAEDSLNEIHQRYVREFACKKRKSWKHTDKVMRIRVLPRLGKQKIGEIKRKDIRRMFDNLSDTPVLANAALAAASAVFKWAVDHELVDANPCLGIARNKTKPVERYLNNDEIRAVWPLFEGLDLYPSSIFRLVLLTAQRPGEVTSMRWEHLDLDAGWWLMPGEPTTGWPGTKNHRDHAIPLFKPALEILGALGPEPSGHVFPSTRRGKCITIPSAVGVWTVAGIARFRMHDLRATAATHMRDLSVPTAHISLVLNHVIKGESKETHGYQRDPAIPLREKHRALEAWSTELMVILQGKGKTDRKADVLPMRQQAAG